MKSESQSPPQTLDAVSVALQKAVADVRAGVSVSPDTDPNAPAPATRGTLAREPLPGAAFSPQDFDVEVTGTALAEADELLKATLDEAMDKVGGNRAFWL